MCKINGLRQSPSNRGVRGGARVYFRSYEWEPESMLLEPESMLSEPESMLLEPESMLLEPESMLSCENRVSPSP